MVVLGWGGVGQWRSCQLAHTRHATLLLCSLALAHTRHATLWWSSLALAHTRHATSWWSSLALAHRCHAKLWWSSLALAHTHVTCYVMVVLGWGWVGWGGAITFMSTCTHTRHATLLLCSLALAHAHTSCYVMVIFSCTCSHTSCYVMVIFSCTCSHTSCYAMVIFSCTCTHTSCAPLFLQMETVLGSHMPKVWKSNMPKRLIKTKNGPNKCEEPPFFSCPLWQGRKSLTDGGKAFPRRLYDGVNTKEHPELEKFVLGYCWRKSLGPLTPHRFLEELCKAVKAMKRFWEEGKKVLHPKKNTNLCQKTK